MRQRLGPRYDTAAPERQSGSRMGGTQRTHPLAQLDLGGLCQLRDLCYEVDADTDARGAEPYWIDERRCRQVSTVAFKRNRALIFLNSRGAHGATIPADAEPEALQRYIYQFRIGPEATHMAALTASLSPDRRAYWEGKQQSY